MDIMKVTEQESIPGLAILIDFKKAFDTVDWNFLFKALQTFNFGPCIQKWIVMLTSLYRLLQLFH